MDISLLPYELAAEHHVFIAELLQPGLYCRVSPICRVGLRGEPPLALSLALEWVLVVDDVCGLSLVHQEHDNEPLMTWPPQFC